MADEFQTGICSSNWWTSSRSPFIGASSPSSTSLSEMGSFGWSSSATDMARSSCQEAASVSGNPIVFQDRHRAVEPSESVADSNLDLMDSALHMSGFGLSTPTIDWNPALPRGSGRAESNFQTMLQQELSSRQNLRQETATDSGPVQKDWMHCDFSSGEDSLITFKPANQGFAFEQQRSNSSSGDCTLTTQSHPSNTYSMSTVSYGYPSTMLQGLFEPDTLSHQTSFDQTQTVNYSASTNNYHMNSNDNFPQSNWPKIPQFLKISHPIKQHASNQLHLSNSNTSFWNPSTVSDDRTSLYSSPLPQYLTQVSEDKPRCSNLSVKRNADEIRDSCSATKKGTSEATFKRPRVETPSPLPTFKVRKEKLGDRITALQQLVSPFGKTDTASVLYEAIEYIRFLHDQISVSITPYMKSGAPMKPQQNEDIASKDGEGAKQDLRTRGLCLVPISSTFLVTNETTADFWTPYIWRNVQVDRDTC